MVSSLKTFLVIKYTGTRIKAEIENVHDAFNTIENYTFQNEIHTDCYTR